MATRFLKINDEFRDSLEETLDKNNHSGKVRPYYYGISYENKIILIPLRSKCPRSYSIPVIIQETKSDQALISVK